MPNKTVANLRINAPEYGMNDSFEIEDTAARAAANAAASTAASTAASVQAMGVRMTAAETKNTQQDTAIANAVEAIAGKTQMYTTAGGVNTPYPQLRIGTGLEVNNGVLSASGGGGDISALTARVAALETNDGIQDTDIDNLQTAMTAAQGDIGALETNDGVQDTDIDDLQTRMSTAENDIDALEANDLRFSLEKTGLYVNSGGTNSYYTDLALGSGLAVTNGVLDVVGGGGGGGFAQCTAIADANDATTPGLYCPASSSATNFPAGADITDLHSGTLIVSTYGSGQNKNLIQQVYIENYNGASASAQLGNAKIWLRVQSNNYSDWPFPSDVTSFKAWQLVASAVEDYVQDIVYAKDGISLVSTSYADPTNWPADLANQSVYAIVITMTTDNNIAGSFDGTQVLITDSGKSYVRTKWQGSWLTWQSIAGGGGNALPDQTTYTTFGSGKRLYVTDTEPTGSDIPLGSVWIGGDA